MELTNLTNVACSGKAMRINNSRTIVALNPDESRSPDHFSLPRARRSNQEGVTESARSIGISTEISQIYMLHKQKNHVPEAHGFLANKGRT
jgi:hypothetical protein